MAFCEIARADSRSSRVSFSAGGVPPTQPSGSKIQVCKSCSVRFVESLACARVFGQPAARRINTAGNQPAQMLQEQTEATEGSMDTRKSEPRIRRITRMDAEA